MSTWTKDKPTTPGKWRVSIAPEKRTSYAFKYVFEGPVSHCSVVLRKTDPDTVQLRVSIDNAEDYRLYSLTDPWFDGALWMRDEHPADPFAEQPKLSPEAERIWKSLSPATEIRGEDARRLLESLVDVASPEEVARRRAVSRQRLSQVGASKTTGLEKRYNVHRIDGKPIKCGCIVLEFDDSKAQPALLVWADSMEAAGYATVAADVRAAVNDANLFRFMPDGTRILKNPQKPNSRDDDLP